MAESWFEIDSVSNEGTGPLSRAVAVPAWAGSASRWLKWLGVPLLFLVLAVVRPDQWWVERVEFRGNLRASAVELRHLVGVRNGTTMWSVDPEAAAEGATNHPWVRHATAWRRWPNTLVVQVEEYRPVALVERDGLYYADSEGMLFLKVRGEDLDHPVISGVGTPLAENHPDIPRLIVRDALALVSALERHGVVSVDAVSSVDFSAVRGFTVYLRSGARVLFDVERYDQQVARLVELTRRGVNLRERVYVDLAPASLAIVRRLDLPAGEG